MRTAGARSYSVGFDLPEVFWLKPAAARAVEFGLARRMKPLPILKQARFDPGDIRNILAAEPKRVAHACGSLLGRSLGQCGAGERDRCQHKDAACDDRG
jgi:hypothetical protein